MANPDDPTENDTIRAEIRAAKSRWDNEFPAIVESYDEQTLRATVQPAIRIRAKSGQQITPSPVTIPVEWISWGPHVFQGKLVKGDEVIVECMDKNWNTWLLTGGVVDDVAIGGSSAGYAVAKPRQLSTVNRPTPLAPGEEIKIGRKDGLTTVTLLSDGTIKLAGVDVELTAGAGLSQFLTVLHTAIGVWVPIANDGGAALQAALAGWLALTPPTGGAPPP